MSHRRKVYVIDDDEAMRDSLNFLLGSANFNVTLYQTALDFIDSVPASTLAAWSLICGCPSSMELSFRSA
jgi:FixJ family two-component response regulator